MATAAATSVTPGGAGSAGAKGYADGIDAAGATGTAGAFGFVRKRARVTTPPFGPVDEHEVAIVSAQLGRPARGVIGIAARCVCGAPTVAATAPRLPNGEPFPTLYYLTHPGAVAAMSRLEAAHLMVRGEEMLANVGISHAYRQAHEAYLRDRATIEDVPEIAGISAGGMPLRVKCFHALAAHALAAGPGVNPIGDFALDMAREAGDWSPMRCSCPDYGL